MRYEQYITKIFAGLSVSLFIVLFTFNSLFVYSLSWRGPHPVEVEADHLEYYRGESFIPLQIVQQSEENYLAVFTPSSGSYYEDIYYMGNSTDSMSWSIRDIQSIVYSTYSNQGYPKSLTLLNNGNIQFTRALQYGENILIRYSFSSNGESWGQSKEAILNLTQAHILHYYIYHEGILVYEQDMKTHYMIYEDLWNYQYREKRLISGYIEESTETFIIEDVELFGEDTSTIDFMVWNGKPTILYRYAYYDENNIGIAVYNNSQFDRFEAVNVDDEEYIELLACNDVLYILYNSASEHLEIAEIVFNYQDMSWQKVNKKTISQGELRSGTVRDIENSENKAIIVRNNDRRNSYYNEGFDMRQLNGYIIKITLFLLVLVVPIAYNKFRKNKKKEMKS